MPDKTQPRETPTSSLMHLKVNQDVPGAILPGADIVPSCGNVTLGHFSYSFKKFKVIMAKYRLFKKMLPFAYITIMVNHVEIN